MAWPALPASREDAALLPEDFARTGRHFVHQGGGPLTRFQVMGERSSGTNYATRLIARNTALTPTEALGWKHGFAQMTAVPPDTIVVCLVRNAADWALSMHAKPWHCSAAMQALPFGAFIRAEWDTRVDRERYFDGATRLGLRGQPLQHDRHPLTGARFADIFALRRAKLAALTGFLARDCTVALLRMEEMIADPEDTIDAFRAAFSLAAPEGDFRGITRRLGSRFKPATDPRPATPEALSPADLDHLRARVDTAQEAMLGYVY